MNWESICLAYSVCCDCWELITVFPFLWLRYHLTVTLNSEKGGRGREFVLISCICLSGVMAGSPCPIEVMKQVLTKLHMPQVTVNTEWLYLKNMTVKVISSIQQLKSSLELNSEHLFPEANETKLFGFPKKRVPPREVNLNFRKFLPRKLVCNIVATFYRVAQHCSNICYPKNRLCKSFRSYIHHL